uniref:autotransporter domain-containing protein n=1 Tax=Sulfuritalea sp. TaxID=2480090 RepID=UPI00286E5931
VPDREIGSSAELKSDRLLGDLAGGSFQSVAYGVNSDGSVVVGRGTSASGQEAFRWTQAGGMQRIADWLAAAGVTVAPGYTMTVAKGVSADGAVVVGESSGPSGSEAFIARISAIGSGAITISDVQASLGAAATGGGMALSAVGTALNGAHSRPLARRVAAGKKAFWVAGDWGTDDHGSRSGDLGLAEVGLGQNFGPLQLSLSLGQTWAKQDLTLNGRAKSDGTYVMAEALVPLRMDTANSGLIATIGAYVHRGDADLRRGYLNAGVQDFSSGKPGADTWGLRARLDWENAATLAGAGLTPYVDLGYNEAKIAAYTETGGGFPAQFNARKETATELRLGLNASKPILNNARLVGTLEAAHRFEGSGARTVGQVVGLFGFDLAGPAIKQDWLRAGVGIEGKLGDGTGALMLNLTTQGEAPNAWLAASWQTAF